MGAVTFVMVAVAHGVTALLVEGGEAHLATVGTPMVVGGTSVATAAWVDEGVDRDLAYHWARGRTYNIRGCNTKYRVKK